MQQRRSRLRFKKALRSWNYNLSSVIVLAIFHNSLHAKTFRVGKPVRQLTRILYSHMINVHQSPLENLFDVVDITKGNIRIQKLIFCNL